MGLWRAVAPAILPSMHRRANRRRTPSWRATPRSRRRLSILAALLIASVGAGPRGQPTARLSAERRAALFHNWAEEGLTDPTVEGRQRAMRDIEEALAIEPNNAQH